MHLFWEKKIHNSSQNKSHLKWCPPNNEFFLVYFLVQKNVIMQVGHFLVEYVAYFPCFCFHI